ncbi:uncharacterized protein LOC124414205 [Diprion similis]|uniref:uncharacterized protein LOC124414205 n=1 Tax=Diprion similis TaxID=362088 RepID=UPI001EF85E72|nr:uncharacterized protein LOC124414205 [Diprion similis]
MEFERQGKTYASNAFVKSSLLNPYCTIVIIVQFISCLTVYVTYHIYIYINLRMRAYIIHVQSGVQTLWTFVKIVTSHATIFTWNPTMPIKKNAGSIYYLESIEVSECSSYPCRIRIGSTVNVTTNFLVQGTAYDSEQLVQDVYFVISSIQLKAQVNPDPCPASNGSNACRLQSGQRVKFQAAVRVDNVPPLPGTLWWTMRNSANQLLVCYKLTVIFMLV